MGRLTAVEQKSISVTLENGVDDARLVQGVARGLSVLRAFKPGESSLSNGELARRTGLSKPTISRLSRTLAALGYLSIAPRTGHFQLGAGVVALYHSLLSGMPLAARLALQEIADFARLPASVATRDQLTMLTIETTHYRETPARFAPGSRLPIETSAMGHACLFAMAEDERDALLQRVRLQRPGSEWRDILARIDQSFESIAKSGFCVSLGNGQGDICAAGAPVVTVGGAVLAFHCGGIPSEVTAARLENEIGPRLARAARQISIEAPTRP